jgi:uncharacterized YigZ family protein
VSSYRVPAAEARAEIRERGSVFLAVLAPAAGEAAAREALSLLSREFPDATHHCWAWRLGWPPSERSADAGEPGGTAGVPILQVLRGAGLSDALAVVVRWFGGVKLGKGGLARAYSAATREALQQLETRLSFPVIRLSLSLSYEQVGAAKRVVHPPEVELEGEEYGDRVRLVLRVHAERRAALEARLADLGIAAASISALPDAR